MTTASAIQHTIHSAGTTDLDRVAATVAAAFLDDPVPAWLLPDETRRVQLAGPLFRLYVEPYLAHGETYLTGDGAGAAVWLPPGAELLTAEQDAQFGQQLEELVGDDIVRFGQLPEVFAEHHPSEPLWYCQFRRPRRYAGLPRGHHAEEPCALRAPRLREPGRVPAARRTDPVEDVARSEVGPQRPPNARRPSIARPGSSAVMMADIRGKARDPR